MRLVTSLLVAVMLVTGAVGTYRVQLEAAAVDGMLEQQPQQPQQPATPVTEQDDGGITSAGWGNIIWIVVALVLGVTFVWLAMAGLRTRSRE